MSSGPPVRKPASRGAVVRLLMLGVLLTVLGTWAANGGGPSWPTRSGGSTRSVCGGRWFSLWSTPSR